MEKVLVVIPWLTTHVYALFSQGNEGAARVFLATVVLTAAVTTLFVTVRRTDGGWAAWWSAQRGRMWALVVAGVATGTAAAVAGAMDSHVPWFAASAALITVLSASRWSTGEGAKLLGATIVGMVIAEVATQIAPASPHGFAAVVVASLAIGWLFGLGPSVVMVPLTALFAFISGPVTSTLIFDRCVVATVGVIVGMLFVPLAFPTSPRTQLRKVVARISTELSELLADMSAGVSSGDVELATAEQWLRRSRTLLDELDELAATTNAATQSAARSPFQPSESARSMRRSARSLWHSCEAANTVARSIFDALSHGSDIPVNLGEVLESTAEVFAAPEVILESAVPGPIPDVVAEARSAAASAARDSKDLEDTSMLILSGAVVDALTRMVESADGSAEALDAARPIPPKPIVEVSRGPRRRGQERRHRAEASCTGTAQR